MTRKKIKTISTMTSRMTAKVVMLMIKSSNGGSSQPMLDQESDRAMTNKLTKIARMDHQQMALRMV